MPRPMLLCLLALSIACAPAGSPGGARSIPPASVQRRGADGVDSARLERAYQVRRNTDAFTKASTADLVVYRNLWDAKAMCTHMIGSPGLAVILRRYVDSTGTATALVSVQYFARDWLFIADGAPLQVLLGDSVHTLPPLGATERKVSGGVSEFQAYRVTAADLRRIGGAPSATVRLMGGEGHHCDFALPRQALALMAMFAHRELGP